MPASASCTTAEGQSRADVLSLLKGLGIIELINASPGLTVKEIAEGSRLARTTAYRTLCTLERNGFIYRERATARYFPNGRLLKLSSGFDLAAQITVAARGQFDSLKPEIEWPMHLATPDLESGSPCMRVRASTDHSNPLAIEKMLPGQVIPVLQCAAGLAWISSLAPAERDPVVDRALREHSERPDQTNWAQDSLEERIARIRACGFAQYRKPGRYTNLVGLSVAVHAADRPIGALSVRFAESAVPMRQAIARFVPPLRAMAARLAATASDARSDARD